jgi:hypothetical protein
VLAAATGAGCTSRRAPKPAPTAFQVAAAGRDDCVHHAAALTAVPEGWLVVSACGHTGEDGAVEEIGSVRIDERGVVGNPEPVQILEEGWATNVLVTAIPGSGGLAGWTQARAKKAKAQVIAVDVQGRLVGRPVVELGPGRLLAMAAGPGGAAVALWSEPDEMSDAGPGAVADVRLVIVDADGVPHSRIALSGAADAERPGVALSRTEGGYAAAWFEHAGLVVAAVDSAAAPGARVRLLGDLGAVGLDENGRAEAPALAIGPDGRATVAVTIRAPGRAGAALGWGQGPIGGDGAAWTWRTVLADQGRRRERLVMQAGPAGGQVALGWLEAPQPAFPGEVAGPGASAGADLVWLVVDREGRAVGAPEVAVPGAVLFDGPVALASSGAGFAAVAATMAGRADRSVLEIRQRLR